MGGLLMPKVGDIEKGYRFLGGDPKDKYSWAKTESSISEYKGREPLVDYTRSDRGEPTEYARKTGQSFLSEDEMGGYELADAFGTPTVEGREKIDKAIGMAQMSSGIVKPSKAFKSMVKEARTRGSTGRGEMLKAPGKRPIPIEEGTDFPSHAPTAEILEHNDLAESYRAYVKKLTKKVGKREQPLGKLEHYIYNEDYIRGAGSGNYEIGGVTPDKFRDIKIDFSKNFRKADDVSDLLLQTFDYKTGVHGTFTIPKSKVNMVDPDELAKVFKQAAKEPWQSLINGPELRTQLLRLRLGLGSQT
jgi:hypothetical protein